MTKRNSVMWFVLVLCLSFIGAIFLINVPYFDISRFDCLGPDFHYNVISMSITSGGFLFTGVSILISVIDKSRIKRLWDNHYLDNLYRSAFTGMFANIGTIASAFIQIFLNIKGQFTNLLINAEIVCLVIGIVFFTWSIKLLMVVISRLK